MDEREAAWSELLDVVPPKWRTGRATQDALTGQWSVAAIGPKVGGRRGPPPESVTGTGPDEVAAVRDLVKRLRMR
jgi:hypothetical protein